jgi:STE24 endopeptidase
MLALARARTAADEWRTALGWLAAGAILFALLKSRLLLTLKRVAVRRRIGRSGVVLLCAVVFALAFEALQAAVGVGLAAIWPAGGAAGGPGGLAAHVLFDTLALWLILAAARAAPRAGWAWLAGLSALGIAAVVLVAPVTLVPMARGDRPAPPAAKAAPFIAFAAKGGLPVASASTFASDDPTAVDAEGLGPIRHLALSRAALAHPQPETYAALGHLLGHHRHGDLWMLTLLVAGAAALGLAALAALAAPLARRLGEGDLKGAHDPAGLPVLGLIAWAGLLVFTPAFNLFDQTINYRADAYALSLTRDPGALCRWIVGEAGASKPDPNPLEALFFYDHPPLKPRLEAVLRRGALNGEFPSPR